MRRDRTMAKIGHYKGIKKNGRHCFKGGVNFDRIATAGLYDTKAGSNKPRHGLLARETDIQRHHGLPIYPIRDQNCDSACADASLARLGKKRKCRR
ncbi:hypothetical protein [Nitrosomonas mobilis]|uniref:Uncharacterized protein n=1 Tax=Nitrosomonas mobilis TaxID=51642 RepID=A0A1G5SGY7_9PROT|nr:hypothetical protein [Nitrosomonas mobilis]SCZ86140.1 hypothetical protein NSMM_490029 [Nitrosomonas mobilis]